MSDREAFEGARQGARNVLTTLERAERALQRARDTVEAMRPAARAAGRALDVLDAAADGTDDDRRKAVDAASRIMMGAVAAESGYLAPPAKA